MVLDKIIAGFLSGKIPERKDTMFWITLLIVSTGVPLSIYGYIQRAEKSLLALAIGLFLAFIILWAYIFIQENKWLKFHQIKHDDEQKNTQNVVSLGTVAALVWLSEKKYISKEIGKTVAQSFAEGVSAGLPETKPFQDKKLKSKCKTSNR